MEADIGEWASGATGELLDDLVPIAQRVTATIRTALPAYVSVPLDEHRAAVADQLAMVLTGLREQRSPGRAELVNAERLGRRRAEQGIVVSALMQAYELPVQELWQRYADLVTDGEQARELIALAPALLGWLHQVGGAAATGHQIVTASRLANDVRMQTELLELVMSDPASAQCASLAAELGLEPNGSFQAVGFIPSSDARELERLHLRLRLHVGTVAAGIHDAKFYVLQQQDRTEVITQLCRPHAEKAVFGIGEPRSGIAGAALSIGDALRAVDLSMVLGEDVVFSEHWLLASVLASAAHLDHLDGGVAIAASNRHLSQTVLAFAREGLSTAAAARTLHLHPNTVAYRLDRWARLTGWRLDDFEGLARSVVCILLSARAASE